MADLFAVLILIPIMAFVLAAVFGGVAIMFAFVYGIIMAFIGWLRH